MALENIKTNRVFHKKFNECGFCGKELKPIGLDYLCSNISEEFLEYERCDCDEAKIYWKEEDLKNELKFKKEKYKKVIKEIYDGKSVGKRLENYSFENFITNIGLKEMDVVQQYTNKCLDKTQSNGLIITGNKATVLTYLAGAIANELIKNDQVVLMGRLTYLLDMIKDTFKDKNKSEMELLELYSNIDMLIIDDLGTERISLWSLEKLYTIISNRYENNLPIIITTRFNKEELIERFCFNLDKDLSDAVISKLYEMCFGLTLDDLV